MPPPEREKITSVSLKALKEKGQKITAITAYDFPTARLASLAGIDVILVGDSLGMVLQGHAHTLKVTIDDIIYHTRHVERAEPHSLIVSDMPFRSFHVSVEKAVENACRCVQEGGAATVKLEGGRKRFKVIEAILNAEIPVMAHLGLTPQSIHQLGGFKVQGNLRDQAREIYEDALALEQIGVCAIVLESIPLELSQRITDSLKVPTIGIGAGKFCDGQILVFQDLVGLTELYLPKFVRRYADTHALWLEALQKYIDDIRHGRFPDDSESYHLKGDIADFLP